MPCRRRASGASSTSWPRWTTSSAWGSVSPTSTRRGSSSRRASSRLREGRTHYTSNHGTLELRRALSAHLERRYGVRVRPGDRDPRHGRGVGGARPRPARDVRPGRRGDPARAVVRRLHPGHRLRRRHAGPRADPLRRRLRARSGGRRGRHHATDEGALPGLPVQPDGRRAARRRPGRARRHRRAPRPARLQRRDLRPAGLRRRTAIGRSARCRACASGRSSWAASRRRTR